MYGEAKLLLVLYLWHPGTRGAGPAGAEGLKEKIYIQPRLACARLKAAGQAVSKAKPKPVARAAEELICHGLGIMTHGQEVTREMVDSFVEKFKEHLSLDMIVAMCGLFKLDDAQAAGLEEALIAHDGAGALDQEA
ncbi:hypothetical protein ZWY2020_006355 [Hordeum vulgare]|nr:hypothetical protein ZWY2020_006355 [Hordeum vulgare]